MTISPKTPNEIEAMREGGARLSRIHEQVYDYVKPGMSLIEIDDYIHQLILDQEAKPSFLGYHGYPAASCLSLNDVVVHGIPDETIIREGDVLGVDIGINFDGLHTDSAVTKAIGQVSREESHLLDVTQEALRIGIEAAKAGNYVEEIGFAIQEYVDSQGKFGIIRDLAGHGVGRKLQEAPQVLNYKNNDRTQLIDGMTLAIEPMISLGDWRVTLDSDNWTVRTRDRSCAAQFETTIVVRRNDPEILVPFPLTRRARSA